MNLTSVTQGSNEATTFNLQNGIYDKLRPKNERKFMSAVRNWEKRIGFITPVRWGHVVFVTLLHVVAAVWLAFAIYQKYIPKWQTVLFALLVSQLAGFGVTAGAHRYWSHRSYKATWPLQLTLLICYSIAGQNSIYDWVRDHRIHHKFSETSTDPHDARRGFFFSHIGWLMMKKHPDVLREGAKVDMSDIGCNPLLRFHTKYFSLFKVVCCFVVPTLVPVLAWDETWHLAILTQPLLRYLYTLHCTWSVNSFAHLWGNKPYDRSITPVENWGVSFFAMGEGWHNYHHTFPWDYRTAELGFLNLTKLLLDNFARIGWAYDLKVTSPDLVTAVVRNRGDGTKVLC